MAIILIALTDIENGIGDGEGHLLFQVPNDMKRFKELTTNKCVVMGRKTWESLPIRPLPKRKNYVLTSDPDYKVDGLTMILRSVDEVLELAKSRDVFVAGGGEVYSQLMPFADKMELTHVHDIHTGAQVFFPEIDVREWKLVKVKEHPASTKEGDKHPSYTFATYERKK